MPTLPTHSFKTTLMASLTLVFFASPAAHAEDETFTLSANAALVTDYRFRGISFSDKDLALQGGFDLTTKSGFYVGTWGSSIDSYLGSELELDIYGGYATSFSDLDFDIGLLAYTYPGSEGTAYLEAYTSIGGTVDILSWTLGTAYAFNQDSTNNEDNIYIYMDTSAPLGETPLSLAGHIAYEDGAFGTDKWDWSVGISYDFKQYSLGLSYIDTNVNSRTGKGGVVASLSASF